MHEEQKNKEPNFLPVCRVKYLQTVNISAFLDLTLLCHSNQVIMDTLQFSYT